MSEAMELSDRQLDQVGGYVKQNLESWMRDVYSRSALPTDPVLLERIVRVEDELKSQRELMQQGFAYMEKRFDQAREDTRARFEQADRRFDEMRADANARFQELIANTNAR
ncbi:MAG: hypothetical protein ACLFP4_10755, partial [Spirochaetales bacterium]